MDTPPYVGKVPMNKLIPYLGTSPTWYEGSSSAADPSGPAEAPRLVLPSTDACMHAYTEHRLLGSCGSEARNCARSR